MSREFPSIPSLLSAYHEKVLNSVKCFCASVEMVMFCSPIRVMYLSDGFLYIEPSSVRSRNKFHLVMAYNPFILLLIFIEV